MFRSAGGARDTAPWRSGAGGGSAVNSSGGGAAGSGGGEGGDDVNSVGGGTTGSTNMFQETQETQEILQSQETEQIQEDQEEAANPESLESAGDESTAQQNEWSSDELIRTKEKKRLTPFQLSAQPELCLALSDCKKPSVSHGSCLC